MIPVNEPLLQGNEKKYLLECIESGWISSEGPFVERFEQQMAAAVQRRHGIAVCNGTAALELAIAALELAPGDEIIMPAFTIISCAAAAVRRGCIPVLVDSDPVTWNMDVSQIEAKITPRTRAIMAVHLYGLPVEMAPVMALAKRHGLKLIEDAAEMHGQSYCGRPCGSFGDLSIFSFYPNKLVTTGEGGMVLTDDERLAARCRSLRNLCFTAEQRFLHTELGYNFRMSNLQAAVGVAQLEQLADFVRRKRQMGTAYDRLLAGTTGLELMPVRTEYAENIYWIYGMVLDDLVPFDARGAMQLLAQRGIGTRPFFWPLHEQPVLREMGLFTNERYPVAERLGRRGFYIPSGLALTGAQLETVARTVRQIMA